jgi:tRNA(Arg) A34 adenosine deaminase TadA
MCAGAIPWSGVVRVVTGALDADVRAIGFDEGAKPEAWAEALRERGIEVTEGVQREAAVAVLKGYAALGGTIY